MVELGGSRSLSDTWTYVQDSEPTDQRNGVRWINPAEGNTAYIYSEEHSGWMRESRVWAQNTAPTPRVGPLDGDQWIDTSDPARPSYVYSADSSGWERPIPAVTEQATLPGGYNSNENTGLGSITIDGTGTFSSSTGTAQSWTDRGVDGFQWSYVISPPNYSGNYVEVSGSDLEYYDEQAGEWVYVFQNENPTGRLESNDASFSGEHTLPETIVISQFRWTHYVSDYYSADYAAQAKNHTHTPHFRALPAHDHAL